MSTIKLSDAAVFQDMCFVLTGQPKYMTRVKLSGLIRDYGGKVANTVSGKTKFLVKGVDGGPSKIRKTLERNVCIMDEDDLFLLIQVRPDHEHALLLRATVVTIPKKKDFLHFF